MCNKGDHEGLREVIGINKIADYIIENRLFKDKICDFDPRVFIDFEEISLQYPKTNKMRNDIIKYLIDNP